MKFCQCQGSLLQKEILIATKTKKHPSDTKHHDLFVTTKYSDAFWGIRVTLTVDAPIKIVTRIINVVANIFLCILKLLQRGLCNFVVFHFLKIWSYNVFNPIQKNEMFSNKSRYIMYTCKFFVFVLRIKVYKLWLFYTLIYVTYFYFYIICNK